MKSSRTIEMLRKDELRRFREYIEDREQPYTRYVVDTDFLVAHGLTDHPRLSGGARA